MKKAFVLAVALAATVLLGTVPSWQDLAYDTQFTMLSDEAIEVNQDGPAALRISVSSWGRAKRYRIWPGPDHLEAHLVRVATLTTHQNIKDQYLYVDGKFVEKRQSSPFLSKPIISRILLERSRAAP